MNSNDRKRLRVCACCRASVFTVLSLWSVGGFSRGTRRTLLHFRDRISAVANTVVHFDCVSGLSFRLRRCHRSGSHAGSANAVFEQSADDSQKPLSKNGGAAGLQLPRPAILGTL